MSLAFGVHRRPVDSPHRRAVMLKMFEFDDVVIPTLVISPFICTMALEVLMVRMVLCEFVEIHVPWFEIFVAYLLKIRYWITMCKVKTAIGMVRYILADFFSYVSPLAFMVIIIT